MMDYQISKKEAVLYLAGATDSEGCLYIAKRRRKERFTPAYEPRLQVGNTSKEMLDLFVKTFGGRITPDKKLTKGGKTYYVWRILGISIVRALEAMLPYLIVKREESKLVIALQERIWRYGKRVGKTKRISPQEIEAREKLYKELKGLIGKQRQLKLILEDTK